MYNNRKSESVSELKTNEKQVIEIWLNQQSFLKRIVTEKACLFLEIDCSNFAVCIKNLVTYHDT